jgi:hypothetical protein
MTNKNEMTEQQRKDWVREQYQVATKYLAQKGLITQSVAVEKSRYLIPILAVWNIKLNDGKRTWVVCGDVPTDHTNIDAAPNVREALRHFSLKWQMQADNLIRAGTKEQEEFANVLIDRAEQIYGLCENPEFWVD